MESYPTIRKKETVSSTVTWMQLEIIILSGINQKETNTI